MWNRVIGLSVLVVLSSGEHPIRQSLVDEVNSKQKLWVAFQPEENPLFGFSESELLGMLGALPDATERNSSLKESGQELLSQWPDHFDARSEYEGCVAPVRNQGQCGSCWAFAASETLRFNRCVLGLDWAVLSPENLLSCDTSNGGCNGGSIYQSWVYIANHGVHTEGCLPYTSGQDKVGPCNDECVSTEASSLVYGCGKAYEVSNDRGIQWGVIERGAVDVQFTVFQDFFSYKSGVYIHQTGKSDGGHAVSVVGYGHLDNGLFYWIVQNSWGPHWGEGGYFKIANRETDPAVNFAPQGFFCIKGDWSQIEVITA